MDRLTIKSEALDEALFGKHFVLKCLVNEDYSPEMPYPKEFSCCDYCPTSTADACLNCGLQEAFDRLAAYEDIGLTPGEIAAMKADNDRLHKLLCEAEDILGKNGRDD